MGNQQTLSSLSPQKNRTGQRCLELTSLNLEFVTSRSFFFLHLAGNVAPLSRLNPNPLYDLVQRLLGKPKGVSARRLLLLFLRVSIGSSGPAGCLVATQRGRQKGQGTARNPSHFRSVGVPVDCDLAARPGWTQPASGFSHFFFILNGSAIRTIVCLCNRNFKDFWESTEQLTGLIQCNLITFMPKKKTQSLTNTDQYRLKFVSAAFRGEAMSLLLETSIHLGKKNHKSHLNAKKYKSIYIFNS